VLNLKTKFYSFFLIFLIGVLSINNFSNAGEKNKGGCADDLNQDALRIAKKAVKDYWIREKAWDAAKRIEDVLVQEPRIYFGYDILKIFYCFHQKKCGQAVAILKKGIKYCPDYHGHYYGLAEVYVKMGLHANALMYYKLAKDKGYPVIDYFYFKVAESHFALKQIDEAIGNLRKALELNEKYFMARRNLIGLLYRSHKKQEALEQARKLVAQKPDAKTLKWAKGIIEKMSR